MAALAASAGRLRERPREAAALAGLLLGAGALGAAAMLLSAQATKPLLGLEICVVAALVVATLARPEIGIAAWFPLVPLGLIGTARVGPQWLLASIWALFLFILAIARRGEDAPRTAAQATAGDSLRSPSKAASLERPGAGQPSVGEPSAGQPSAGAAEQARRWHQRLPPLAPALLALFAITLLEALLDVHLSTALKAIRAMVTGTLVFFAIATFVRNRNQLMWLLGGIALAAALVGAVAINDYRSGNTTFGFFGPSGELVGRVTAGFGQPNQLGGFLAILVPLTIAAMLLARRGKLLFLLAGLLALAGVYLSYSRGALLAVAVAPLVFLGLRRSLLIVPIAAAVLLNLIPGVLKERFTTLTEGGGDASRLDIWRAAGKIWSAHPVFGVGPGGFPQAYSDANIPGKAFLPSTIFQPPPHAHDLVLNLLAEQGLVGLLAFLTLFGLTVAGLSRARRSEERWVRIAAISLLAMLAVFFVHNLFDVTLIEGTGEYVWALFGVCSALIAIEQRRVRQHGYEIPIAVSGARRRA
jgi:O-antigen ligase